MSTQQDLIHVMDQLTEWIESFDELSSVPIVALTLTANSSDCIEIGGICVWSSEEPHDEGETTLLEHCKTEYLHEIRNLSRFLTPPTAD